MPIRARSGRVVVLGVFVLGAGLAIALNVLTRGVPDIPAGVRVLTSPSSGPATAGRTYGIRLLSPCAAAVDFDGTFWDPDSGDTHLQQPAEPATVRLVGTDRVLLRTAAGQSIALVPIGGPLVLSRCP